MNQLPFALLFVVILASVLPACVPPPPAPEGLNEAARHMIREFYSDDATVGAGLTGLLNWYEAEGWELTDQGASAVEAEGSQPSAAFTLADLEAGDLGRMNLPDDGRDLSLANGIVSLSDMACHWRTAEGLLARGDQDVVFEDFDSYDRTYVTSRSTYQAAASSESFAPIVEPLPDVLSTDFEAGELAQSLLLTTSLVESTELNVTMNYGLKLHFRHGVFTVKDEETPVFMILAWLPEAVTSDGGGTHFAQNYSIEVNYGLGQRTLRIFANWTYIDSNIAGPDSPIWSTSAVNKSQKAAERLSDICAGEIDIPAES